MARAFDIPSFYRSAVVSTVKNARKRADHRKRDFEPSVLDFGKVRFKIARHFGLCFGVENAIEIAYRALAENPDKRVFLLSEMIHNPHVNGDLKSRGVRFILAPDGTQLIPFEELGSEDIVIVPAFGTSVELFKRLESLGIDPSVYNTTCPFVERVWKRAADLGKKGFSIVIHGKHSHEETRATFSHARLSGPSLVVRDMAEAKVLALYIRGERSYDKFSEDFPDRASEGFDPRSDLSKIGVVNQTTMLATETQEITSLLRSAVLKRYGEDDMQNHFADTRDTLCYATSENQDAVLGLIKSGGDIAVVVGGYNSSNTSHLVELCEEVVPTFYIKDATEIVSAENIRHLALSSHSVVETEGWLPKDKDVVDILLTAGASCPDILVDQVIARIAELLGVSTELKQALDPYSKVIESAENGNGVRE